MYITEKRINTVAELIEILEPYKDRDIVVGGCAPSMIEPIDNVSIDKSGRVMIETDLC